MCAIPTANVGAPPAREIILLSPTSAAIWFKTSGVMTKPQLVTVCEAAKATSAIPPGFKTLIGLFMAKYTPGSMIEAAIKAIIATNDSINIPP